MPYYTIGRGVPLAEQLLEFKVAKELKVHLAALRAEDYE